MSTFSVVEVRQGVQEQVLLLLQLSVLTLANLAKINRVAYVYSLTVSYNKSFQSSVLQY